MPKKQLTQACLKRLDKPIWCAVGRHVESVDDEIPDLAVECDDDGLACALAVEIANRLNSYCGIVKDIQKLTKHIPTNKEN